MKTGECLRACRLLPTRMTTQREEILSPACFAKLLRKLVLDSPVSALGRRAQSIPSRASLATSISFPGGAGEIPSQTSLNHSLFASPCKMTATQLPSRKLDGARAEIARG